jgi:hypothetical protein
MFLFKLVSSMLLLFPLYLMLSASFARSVRASRFLSGVDFSLVIDFVYRWRDALPFYLVVFTLVCGLLVIVFIFLSGGFWGILREKIVGGTENSTMERFFAYCGRYFWGMLKISLLLAVLYFLAFWVFLAVVSLFSSVAGKASLWEVTSWRMVARFAIGMLLFWLVNMVGDYLRICLVKNHGERFFRVVRTTLRFLLTNLLGALSLYYSLSVVLLVLILLCIGLEQAMDALPDTGVVILLTFAAQQVFVLFRSYYRLVYYSSQLAFYDHITGGPAAAG